jgi:hypothetical protein
MKVGIVGLRQAGKTTLFRAITRGEAPVDEYGGHANVGVVPLPDERLHWIAECYRPKKVTPAAIEFIDGAAKIGDEQRAKFGSDFFADVRAVDALLQVVRAFTTTDGEPPTPAKDVRALTEELILADLQIVESRLSRLEKSLMSVRHGTITPETIERDLLLAIKDALESGQLVKSARLTPDQEKMIRGFDFMTAKPQIVVANIPESEIGQPESRPVSELRSYCQEAGLTMLALSAKVEAEVAELPEDEQRDYLEAMGLAQPARDQLASQTLGALGLITFYTASEPEVRAWTVPQGTHVIDAAGKVHTDMARGFIRAEVGHFDQVKAAGGWEEAKRADAIHLQTKDYVVQDGDIIYIRFKV